MKLQTFSTALVAVGALASSVVASTIPQVLVTFPSGTPDYIVSDAKSKVVSAGGVVTHEFTLIKGFVATTEAKILDEIRTMSTDFVPIIENDGQVSINDN